MRVDLHNHTTLCNHATGSMEEYIKRAIELKIDVFGFSDHAPMDFDLKYRMSIDQKEFYENSFYYLQQKYKDEIDLKLAYEVDFMNDDKYIEDKIIDGDIDYLIGSVHFINKWGFDNPEFIGEYKNKDIDLIWEDYFDVVLQMVKSNKFDIVGHIDLLKVFKYLPKKNIKLLALDTLKEIKKSGMVLEINSSGFRKPIKEQYPSRDILELAYELNIPITFGSDAHKVEQVGLYYDESVLLAKEIGYKECVYFTKRDKERVYF